MLYPGFFFLLFVEQSDDGSFLWNEDMFGSDEIWNEQVWRNDNLLKE